MVLGREVLLGTVRLLATLTIEVPEWGGQVIVRELTKREAADAQKFVFGAVDVKGQTISDTDKLARFNVRLVRYGWVDEDGNQVIAPNEEEQLFDMSNGVLERLGAAIAKLSGLGENNDAKADIEAAKKN